MLGERDQKAVPRIRARTVVRAAPVAVLVGALVRAPAEGIVMAADVVHDAHQNPSHVGEEQAPGTDVGIPLDLEGVRDIEALDRRVSVVEEEIHAPVPIEIRQPEARPARQHTGRVTASADRLVPYHIVRPDTGGQAAGLAGRDRRLRGHPGPCLGARVRARLVGRRGVGFRVHSL